MVLWVVITELMYAPTKDLVRGFQNKLRRRGANSAM